jgi:hypothetical protein
MTDNTQENTQENTQKIIDLITENCRKRVGGLTEYLKDDIFNKVASLSSMDCYTIFGIENNNIDGLEQLHGIIVNGLYDDAELGIIYKKPYHGIVGYVSDDFTNILDESHVLALIDEVSKASEYYKANSEAIEKHDPISHFSFESREYTRIGNVYEDLVVSLMCPSDRFLVAQAKQKWKHEIEIFMDKFKEDEENI